MMTTTAATRVASNPQEFATGFWHVSISPPSRRKQASPRRRAKGRRRVLPGSKRNPARLGTWGPEEELLPQADAAREIMRTHDLAFATRPINSTAKFLLGEGSYGIVSAPYGEGWRQLRRICTMELFSARRVRSFRAVREEEVRRLLRSVAAAPPGQAINLSERISAYVADAAVRAIIGTKFRDRETFLRLLERRLKIVPASSLPDLFPSSRLAMLVSRMPRLLKRERQNMMAFVDTIIQEHQDNRRAAGDDDEGDLLDVLLRIQREDELDPPLTTDNIKSVIISKTIFCDSYTGYLWGEQRNIVDHAPVDHGGAHEELESDA